MDSIPPKAFANVPTKQDCLILKHSTYIMCKWLLKGFLILYKFARAILLTDYLLGRDCGKVVIVPTERQTGLCKLRVIISFIVPNRLC